MLRTALRPKWLLLLLVVILVAVGFVQLGRWQLGRAHDQARAEAVAAAAREPVVPVEQLLTPYHPFPPAAGGRIVTVTGTYEQDQVLVPGRRLDGRDGYWLLTPLRTPEASFTVVRGFTETPRTPTPPSGTLTVTVSLAPGESPAEGDPAAGQLDSVDLARLVNRWPGALYNAFGFAQREDPGTTSAGTQRDSPASLTRIPPPRVDTAVNARNAGYALQWWIFAAFAFFLWLKMVQADARGVTSRRRPGPGQPPRAPTNTPTPIKQEI